MAVRIKRARIELIEDHSIDYIETIVKNNGLQHIATNIFENEQIN